MVDGVNLRPFAGRFATGVMVVTTKDKDDGYYGLTMNAVSCVCLDPPTFLICIDKTANSLAPLMESRVFALNILAQGQTDISNTFATKGNNKFANVKTHPGALGAPLIEGALASAEFRVTEIFAAGDHFIVLGEAHSSEVAEVEPLLYYQGKYGGFRV